MWHTPFCDRAILVWIFHDDKDKRGECLEKLHPSSIFCLRCDTCHCLPEVIGKTWSHRLTTSGGWALRKSTCMSHEQYMDTCILNNVQLKLTLNNYILDISTFSGAAIWNGWMKFANFLLHPLYLIPETR